MYTPRPRAALLGLTLAVFLSGIVGGVRAQASVTERLGGAIDKILEAIGLGRPDDVLPKGARTRVETILHELFSEFDEFETWRRTRNAKERQEEETRPPPLQCRESMRCTADGDPCPGRHAATREGGCPGGDCVLCDDRIETLSPPPTECRGEGAFCYNPTPGPLTTRESDRIAVRPPCPEGQVPLGTEPAVRGCAEGAPRSYCAVCRPPQEPPQSGGSCGDGICTVSENEFQEPLCPPCANLNDGIPRNCSCTPGGPRCVQDCGVFSPAVPSNGTCEYEEPDVCPDCVAAQTCRQPCRAGAQSYPADCTSGGPPPPGAECTQRQCGPVPGMPRRICPDGVTYAGPTGNCVRKEDGQCGWEMRECPATPPPPPQEPPSGRCAVGECVMWGRLADTAPDVRCAIPMLAPGYTVGESCSPGNGCAGKCLVRLDTPRPQPTTPPIGAPTRPPVRPPTTPPPPTGETMPSRPPRPDATAIRQTYCLDSDGGQNPQQKGTVTQDGITTFTDSCTTDGRVNEGFCEGGDSNGRATAIDGRQLWTSATIPCRVGMHCVDGACGVSPPPIGQTWAGSLTDSPLTPDLDMRCNEVRRDGSRLEWLCQIPGGEEGDAFRIEVDYAVTPRTVHIRGNFRGNSIIAEGWGGSYPSPTAIAFRGAYSTAAGESTRRELRGTGELTDTVINIRFTDTVNSADIGTLRLQLQQSSPVAPTGTHR